MNIDDDLLRFIPRRVAWQDVTDVERFDDRFGAVNVAVGPIMDVTDEYVELSSDTNEPAQDELVAWAWLIRPDLGRRLREVATGELRDAIDAYEAER
jgi:hypothetical protein